MEVLIVLALTWFFRTWFAGATLKDVEDFLICKEVAGEELGER